MAPPPKPDDAPRSPTLDQLVTTAGEPETTDLVAIDPDAHPPALRPQDAERLAELWERTTPPSTQRARCRNPPYSTVTPGRCPDLSGDRINSSAKHFG